MENKGFQKRMGRGQRDQGCICGGGEQMGGMCLQCKVALMWECFVVGRVQTEDNNQGEGGDCDCLAGSRGPCMECKVGVMWRVFVGEGMWGGIRERRERLTERQDGRGEAGQENREVVWEEGRGQGLGVVESDGSVIVESDSEVEVDVEVEGDSEVIEGDRERKPQPGTSGLGVHGGGNGNGTEGATRDMGLKRSAQGLNEGKEVTVVGKKGLGWRGHIA